MHGLQQQLHTGEACQQAVVGFAIQVGEVEAGAEMAAGARQHQKAQGCILNGHFNRLGERSHQRSRQRIAPVGPVQLQVQHAGVAPADQVGAAHADDLAHRLGARALE